MAHGSQGLFTQVGFNDQSQEDASQGHFGVASANPLQSQVLYCCKECLFKKIHRYLSVYSGRLGVLFTMLCC